MFSFVGCSSSGGSVSPAITRYVTIEADGVEVEKFDFESNQSVNFKAVLREASGDIVAGHDVKWAVSVNKAGVFSNSAIAETVFTAVPLGNYDGDIQIGVDCGGVRKFIVIQVNFHTVEISGIAVGDIINANSSKTLGIKIYKNGILQTGVEYETTWSVTSGIIAPKKTLPGATTVYKAGTYTGEVVIAAELKAEPK